MRKLAMVLAIILFASVTNGQFIQLNSGETDNLTVITHNGGTQFIGGFNKILKSTDTGLTWQTVLLLNCGEIKHIVFSGNNGLASTVDRLFNSLDGGNSWNLVNLPDSISSINDISFRNNFEAYVLATKPGGSGCGGRVFRSFTQGAQWTKVESFEYNNSEPTAMCWKNDTAFTVLRFFNGTDYFNYMAEMGTDFSIQNTQTIFTGLFYATKLAVSDNRFIIYGYNSFGKSLLIQKVFSDYTSYEAILFSQNSIYFQNMNLTNNQAILCGMNGLMEKVSTIGDLSVNSSASIPTGTNAPLFSVDIFQNFIYAVGYNGTLITNNPNLTNGILENISGTNAISCQNPFENELNIRSQTNGLIKIFDMSGKLVASKIKNSEEVTMETDNLPKGGYMLTLGTLTKTIIK